MIQNFSREDTILAILPLFGGWKPFCALLADVADQQMLHALAMHIREGISEEHAESPLPPF